MLYDPLVLLEIKEMKCGQVNRIVCDLIDSVGGEARVVQLGGHVMSEILYDLDWHYFDADMFIGGCILKVNRKIPSIQEMSEFPYMIDQLGLPHREGLMEKLPFNLQYYPSKFYFCRESYTTEPYVCYKTASEYECLNEVYGWNYYLIEEDCERKLDADCYMCVGVPIVVDVQVDDNTIYLKWNAAFDGDKDTLGYKIYVSKKSRGWDYSSMYAEEDALQYIKESYHADQYDFIMNLPFSDVLYTETVETEALIVLSEKGIYYISIMPFDKHGEDVGIEMYFPSDELRVNIITK